MLRRLGLIVNPIAGMGGAVGLKGTDGALAEALRRGAQPVAAARAVTALEAAGGGGDLEIVTAPGAMGEAAARAAGVAPRVLDLAVGGRTTAAHTRKAARALVASGVDLLLFVGGDGTARDVLAAVGDRLPVLGVPAGVKMHSAVHANSPRAAGRLVRRLVAGEGAGERLAEVMDVDESALRRGEVSARLFGYLRVPEDRELVQGVKRAGAAGERASLAGIAQDLAERMADGAAYVLGPGTTTRAVADCIGVPKTLLGVDVVRAGTLVVRDATERQLLAATEDAPVRIVVTPIGGQGHILGRGNQPISARVVARVLARAGRAGLIVVATPGKLEELGPRPLLVDTGDPALDGTLVGYQRVIVGFGREVVLKVAA
jgi:predicted polyphosphate/ATP-dependent NAD kinase